MGHLLKRLGEGTALLHQRGGSMVVFPRQQDDEEDGNHARRCLHISPKYSMMMMISRSSSGSYRSRKLNTRNLVIFV